MLGGNADTVEAPGRFELPNGGFAVLSELLRLVAYGRDFRDLGADLSHMVASVCV